MPAPGTPPTYAPAPGQPMVTGPYSSSGGALPESLLGPVDREAMDNVQLASILALVGVVVSLILPYAFGYSLFGSLNTRSSYSSVNVVVALMAVYVVAVAFVIAQYWFFRKAFRALAPTDGGMRTPASLAILPVIGLIVLLGGFLWILAQAYHAVQCANGVTPIPSSCFTGGLLLGAAGILAIGAIVALVGVIGVWLGLWRMGTRYSQSMFKIGMILTIFPFLDIVGYILLILASREVRSKLAPRSPALPT